MSAPERVIATEETLRWIERLREKHGALLFYQSGGCCEGSAPLCNPLEGYYVGRRDIRLGEIGGCPFYIREDQFEYWRHTQLIIDVVEGGSNGFSLEAPEGISFHTRSRVFSDAESVALAAAGEPPRGG
ncbi:DUF779 domain-containing protein [Rhodoblastus acidophilus]|uniref:DUF779 domain-containing protein n=1 Tax=Rhodoblastus acidophilus TaxID=1074 RepID=A0A6N8DLS8_RHOAC|nr:DUF779 domain-containing protein [Rhodoblastus acidophilus]MCW2275022.1 uncharacterized protein (DUF779 family) [Rhodoblastus acidophilus]MTV31298.1 DUF779 domain-containing protein [Rhodoblastus acidophilus]